MAKVGRIAFDYSGNFPSKKPDAERFREASELLTKKREQDLKKFTKHDQGKPRTDLLPPLAVLEVAKVLEHGARKYDESNWNKCDKPNRYTAASLRHKFQDLAAQLYPDLFTREDEDSKILHLAHDVCSGLFELELLLVRRLRCPTSKAKIKKTSE